MIYTFDTVPEDKEVWALDSDLMTQRLVLTVSQNREAFMKNIFGDQSLKLKTAASA